MDIETWLAERRLGVSGTDIGILMGVNPYKTVDELILDKLGVGKKFEGNLATQVGLKLEPIVAKLWAERNKKEIVQGEFSRHKDNERFIGTPDFIALPGGLEIKTGGEKMYSKGCPIYYEMQSRWYMLIKDLPYWDLVACIVPKDRKEVPLHMDDDYLTEWVKNRPHREFRFERNPEIEARMIHLASEFLGRMDALRQPRQVSDWLRSSSKFVDESAPPSC